MQQQQQQNSYYFICESKTRDSHIDKNIDRIENENKNKKKQVQNDIAV